MSSRATEITLLLILLQASIGFVNAIHLFDHDYYTTSQNTYSNYSVGTLQQFQEAKCTDLSNPTVSCVGDYISLAATWAWQTLIIALQVVLSVVTIFPLLVWTFHVPVPLSAFLQVAVYYVYWTWYDQRKSGRGYKFFE